MEICISVLIFGSLIGGLTSGQMIEYTFDCNGQNLTPENITCPGDRFVLSCLPQEVVVATVCLGKSNDSRCEYSDDCRDEFWVSFDNTFTDHVKSCLWTNNTCDIEVQSKAFSTLKNNCGLSIFTHFSYLVAFNLQCISASIVFNVCSQKNTIDITNDTSLGYVHSPGFPSETGDLDCNSTFVSDMKVQLFFLIQHIQVGTENGNFLEITVLDADGSSVTSERWKGLSSEHQNYTSVGYGFRVRLLMTSNSPYRGVLLSYSAKISDEPEETTTSPSVPEATPTIGCGSRLSEVSLIYTVFHVLYVCSR